MRLTRRGILTTSVIVMIAGGFVASSLVTRHTATVLPDDGPAPTFTLMNQQRQRVTSASLQGSVWIADFIFTRCAGQCPMMSQQMARLQRAWSQTSGIRFISISVDPQHDTPEVLSTYASQYGADAGRWDFLTGDAAALTELVQHGFHLGLGTNDSPAEPITHSVRLVLVDRTGRLRGYYDATDENAMHRLQDDVQRLLRDRSS